MDAGFLARAPSTNGVVIDERMQRHIVERYDLGDLVRGAKAVEEAQHGYPRSEGRSVTDGMQ